MSGVVQRRRATRTWGAVPPAEAPSIAAIATDRAARRPQCRCDDDPQVQTMLALMGRGLTQREASLIAFGGATYVPDPADRPALWSAWIRAEVNRLGNAALRSLGLPELPIAAGR